MKTQELRIVKMLVYLNRYIVLIILIYKYIELICIIFDQYSYKL